MHSQQGRIDLPSAVDEDLHKAAVAQNFQVADVSLVYHGGAALALNDEAAFGVLAASSASVSRCCSSAMG